MDIGQFTKIGFPNIRTQAQIVIRRRNKVTDLGRDTSGTDFREDLKLLT